jgi:hypothetical protein
VRLRVTFAAHMMQLSVQSVRLHFFIALFSRTKLTWCFQCMRSWFKGGRKCPYGCGHSCFR